jgi:hypothetical protein
MDFLVELIITHFQPHPWESDATNTDKDVDTQTQPNVQGVQAHCSV